MIIFSKQRVSFYMKGGHIIKIDNVETVTMTRDVTGGGYSGYNVTWLPNCQPMLFSLAIPDIVGVEAVRVFSPRIIWGKRK